MKAISTLVLFTMFFFISKGVSSQIDVLHYKFEITLSDSSDIIKGVAGIRFKVTTQTSFISFDLVSVNNAKKRDEGD